MHEPTKVNWSTKIAVVLRDDLEGWQKLNVTAFLTSGIAATVDGVVGVAYRDGSDQAYLPMFRQPVLVFGADEHGLRLAFDRAHQRGVAMAIYPEALFATNNDDDNRASIVDVPTEDLRLAGFALRDDKKVVDKVLKGLRLHA